MSILRPTTNLLDRTRLDPPVERQQKQSPQKNIVRRSGPPVQPKVQYRNAEAVRAFLAAQPGLDKFIEAAWPALSKHFGPAVEVILEVIALPYADAQSELVGWIQAVGTTQDVLAKFDRFVDEWFLDHMAEVNNCFNFNIEIR